MSSDVIGPGTTVVAAYDGGSLVPVALRPPGLGLGVPLAEVADGAYSTSLHYLTALPVGGAAHLEPDADHADGTAGFGPHHGGSVIGIPHPHVHYPPNYIPFLPHAAACEDAGACPGATMPLARVPPVSHVDATVAALALPHARAAVSHSLGPDEARRAHLPGAAADLLLRRRKREGEVLAAARREAVVMGRPVSASTAGPSPRGWWADDEQLAAEARVVHTPGCASWGSGWDTFAPSGLPLTAGANRLWGMPSATVWEPFAFHRARARCSALCRQHPAVPGMCEDARCGAQCMMAAALRGAE